MQNPSHGPGHFTLMALKRICLVKEPSCFSVKSVADLLNMEYQKIYGPIDGFERKTGRARRGTSIERTTVTS